MSSILKKIVSGILTILVVVSVFSFSSVAVGDTNTAVTYLKTQNSANPWAAMALAAVGEHPDVSGLKTLSSPNATDYAAAILALTANNQDPRTYPNSDYVAALKALANNSQIGDVNLLNDDVFGILALISAGITTSDTVISDSKAFILSHQNSDGGWSYSPTGTSDTNDTAAAIMALISAGSSASDTAITKAVAYLKTAQNADGGFPYDPKSQWGTDSDSASTAWVISALNRVGENTSKDFLLSLQDATGYFKFQSGSSADTFTPVTTSYAVIALSGKYFPVGIFATSDSLTAHYRITGSAGDICEGDASAPNALELVKVASVPCKFTYHIKDTSYGPYLDQINNDVASGEIGWQYTVNAVSPNVGAVDYKLSAGDQVIWHFGDSSTGGTQVNQELPLSANIESGGGSPNVSDSKISFTLSSGGNNLGFGSIARGSPYSKNVTVANSGQVKIHVEALVSGDDMFKNYLQLNSAPWRNYKDTIEAGANKSVGVGLNVPTSYSGSGTKNGKLIIWAIQTQ